MEKLIVEWAKEVKSKAEYFKTCNIDQFTIIHISLLWSIADQIQRRYE